MTTALAVKANEGIVVASDLRINCKKYKDLSKVKIHISNSNDFLFLVSGTIFPSMFNFFEQLKEMDSKEVIEDLSKNVSNLVKSANVENCIDYESKYFKKEDITKFIFATRFKKKGEMIVNEPELYKVYPAGKVELRYWTAMGSGRKYVLDYLNKNLKDNVNNPSENISIGQAINVAYGALEHAVTNDLGSEGYDLAVITKGCIDSYYLDFKKAFEKAKKSTIESIFNTYNNCK